MLNEGGTGGVFAKESEWHVKRGGGVAKPTHTKEGGMNSNWKQSVCSGLVWCCLGDVLWRDVGEGIQVGGELECGTKQSDHLTGEVSIP